MLTAACWAGAGSLPSYSSPASRPHSCPTRPAQGDQNVGWESRGASRPRSTPGLAPRWPGPAAAHSWALLSRFQPGLCSPSAHSLPGAPIFQGTAGWVHGHSPAGVWRIGVHGLRRGIPVRVPAQGLGVASVCPFLSLSMAGSCSLGPLHPPGSAPHMHLPQAPHLRPPRGTSPVCVGHQP